MAAPNGNIARDTIDDRARYDCRNCAMKSADVDWHGEQTSSDSGGDRYSG
jgi:hypothetical protein